MKSSKGFLVQGLVTVALATAIVGFSRAARAQAPEQAPGMAALKAAEAALVKLIEGAEPSVVAITRQTGGNQNNRSGLLLGPVNPQDADPFNDLRLLAESAAPTEPAGAGVVIDASGLILTQYLVVKPGAKHRVTTIEGRTYPAEIRAADPRSGLAVLAVKDAELKALNTGRAEDLRKGSRVVAIGNPYAVLSDGQPTASQGTVTNLARKAGPQVNLNNTPDKRNGDFRTTLHHYGALIQTDARLGWNAAGGALVNLDGELVGLITTVSVIAGHEQPAGYAIPLNPTFRRVVEDLKAGREAEYGLLGITFSASVGSNTTGRATGILVQQAFAGGPADRAGLRPRDLITKIAGQEVPNSDRLQLVIGQAAPGSDLEIEYLRNGQPRRVSVALGKYYSPGEKVITAPARKWRGIRVDYSTAIESDRLLQASRQGLIDRQGCVVVADVDQESASWMQGVRPGMFISHVGGERVASPQEFWAAADRANESVKLRFTQSLASDRDPAGLTPPE